MNWIRLHPYLSTLITAGILLLIGGSIVIEHAQTVTPTDTTAWGSGTFNTQATAVSDTNTNTTDQASIIEQAVNTAVSSTPAPNYTPPTATNTASTDTTAPSKTFDYNSFLLSLTQAATSTHKIQNASTTAEVIASAYAYIPRGLISTSTPSIPERTATQAALYHYGNEVGSYIQSFDESHADTTHILQDQIADRNNPDKIAAVERLGKDLAAVGKQLDDVSDVPPTISAAHKALVASYTEIGQDLQKVPQTSYDSDFIAAIKTYDAAADTYTKNFIQLSLVFTANGVIFSPQDSGSVFTFTQNTL